MPLKIVCPHCGAQLKGKPELAGKRLPCPNCRQPFQVPAEKPGGQATATKSPPAAPAPPTAAEDASDIPDFVPAETPRTKPKPNTTTAAKTVTQPKSPPTPPEPPEPEPLWQMQTDDGSIYGPVTKAELDRWVDEGRVDADCRLALGDSGVWQEVWDVYPELRPTPSTEPSSAVGTSAVSKAPLTLAEAERAKRVTGELTGSLASTVAKPADHRLPDRPRRRTYPMMRLASTVYWVMGWVVCIVGGLGVSIYLVIAILAAVAAAAGTGSWWGSVVVMLTSLIPASLAVLYVAAITITCWFFSEAIQWMLDLADNTQRCSEQLEEMARR